MSILLTVHHNITNPTWMTSEGDFDNKKLSIDVLWSTSFMVMTNYPGLSHMTKMYTETSDVTTTYPSDISTRGKVLN